jgi:hypothetical protein
LKNLSLRRPQTNLKQNQDKGKGAGWNGLEDNKWTAKHGPDVPRLCEGGVNRKEPIISRQ